MVKLQLVKSGTYAPGGGGGLLPYKGLMRTCGQPGYIGIFVLNRVSFLRQEPITLFLDDKEPALVFYGCLKLGIKNRNSVLTEWENQRFLS